uniref:WLM domain-containing protein n=1 Tax=Parastrongyloides trichosuri TaxID=131310 RepID=A0A0N4ZVK4_PARTI
MRTALSQSRKFLPSSLPAIYYDESITEFEESLIEALTDELFKTKNYWRPTIKNNFLVIISNGAKIQYELKKFGKMDDRDFVKQIKQEYANQISPQCYNLGLSKYDEDTGVKEYEVKYIQSGHDRLSRLHSGLDIRSAIIHVAVHILDGPWVKNDPKIFDINPRLVNYSKVKTKARLPRIRDREVKCLTPQEQLKKRLEIYDLCNHLSIAASFIYLEKNSGTCSRDEYIAKGLLGRYPHQLTRPPSDLANPFSRRKQMETITKKNDSNDEEHQNNGVNNHSSKHSKGTLNDID